MGLAVLIAGAAIVFAYASLCRLGRDPLGPRPVGELPNTALALFLGFGTWIMAQLFVVPRFVGGEGAAGISGRTVAIVVVVNTHVLIALALLWPALRGRPRPRISAVRIVAAGVLAAVVLLAGQIVYSVVMTAAYRWAGAEPPMQALVEESMHSTGRDFAVRAIAAVVLAPFAEEVFFRGILFPAVAHGIGPARGLVVQAAAFGLIHCWNQWEAWPQAVALAGVGWLAGWLYLRTGSLVAPMVMHASFNAANLVAMTMAEKSSGS